MALREKDEQYTFIALHENGNVIRRRIHKLTLQDRLGQVWNVRGDQLPESMSLYTGATHKCEHLVELIMRPEKVRPRPSYVPPSAPPWPTGRDVVSMVLGYLAFSTFALIMHAVVIAN
jgi:hypothetical protein